MTDCATSRNKEPTRPADAGPTAAPGVFVTDPASSLEPAASETVSIGFQRIEKTAKAGWIRTQFDAVADRYDFMNTLLSGGIHHLWKRTAIRWLAPKPGDRILDLCGGTGDLALSAARITGTPSSVVLCDINRNMMNAGRRKPAGRELRRRLSWIQGDAEALPFADNSLDAAMAGFGIRNLTDMDAGLAEIHRVLRPGGVFVCLEFSRPATPVFAALYDLYSFYLMPVLGGLITGSRSAYTYLPESIRLFPDPPALADRLHAAGFRDVDWIRLTDGIAALHRGRKPAGAQDAARQTAFAAPIPARRMRRK
ncbi:MAG: bifunctional demethylmenaquinone methyltransferase/2-methoxy-6-polyprenyl-1,4-benzoquinol methylase UbiE [Desulfobacterales bacterium]|nr:MAG: bifunctional demethylmenaquinone methyltransferase/2-methoxy-6-polyprenyl-1,4-benzoquinol methylase UbiE [Desulfobacterales bacterium]